MYTLIAEPLNPEHTVQVRCPVETCKMRSFACCEGHGIEAMHEHLEDMH